MWPTKLAIQQNPKKKFKDLFSQEQKNYNFAKK